MLEGKIRRLSSASMVLTVLVLNSPAAGAASIDTLKGKFAFLWTSDPSKVKCIAVDDELLAKFKSKQWRCDLTGTNATSAGAKARSCRKASTEDEYLIFDTRKACEEERQTQEAAE